MAGPYATVSNAFRQPNIPDTYVSLVIEAFNASGTPYTVPLTEADITTYITTTYPLFAFVAATLTTQLARALRLGIVFDCGVAGYQLRQDSLKVNPSAIKFYAPRLYYGGPLLEYIIQLPDIPRSGICTDRSACTGGSVSSYKVCPGDCSVCAVSTSGCCPAPAPACTPCCQ